MNTENKAIAALVESLIYRTDEKTEMNLKCLELLSEEELWLKPNAASNSVGNLLLHLCGNISQYIISGLGQQADTRKRELEFSTKGGYSKKELLDRFQQVLEQAKTILRETDSEAWLKTYRIQGFELTGVGIAVHAVEHYAYHTGQIAFWTKMLKEQDLGFYDGINLDAKNEI